MTTARPLRLGVIGASGRMGRAVVRLATEDGLAVVAAVAGASHVDQDAGELAGVGRLGLPIRAGLEGLDRAPPDVMVDFSTVPAARELFTWAARTGVPVVSGTTGLGEEGEKLVHAAARRTAVLWEPNMSVGVHVLGVLLRRALELVGPGADVEIVETHHRRKVDAPSGTALRLVEAVHAARGEVHVTHGRSGRPGERPPGEIGVHAVRGGDVIGDHDVHVLLDGERLQLTHRATDRALFARGALRAARFLAGKAAGRYTLADVLAT